MPVAGYCPDHYTLTSQPTRRCCKGTNPDEARALRILLLSPQCPSLCYTGLARCTSSCVSLLPWDCWPVLSSLSLVKPTGSAGWAAREHGRSIRPWAMQTQAGDEQPYSSLTQQQRASCRGAAENTRAGALPAWPLPPSPHDTAASWHPTVLQQIRPGCAGSSACPCPSNLGLGHRSSS